MTDTWDVPELKPESVTHFPCVPALAPPLQPSEGAAASEGDFGNIGFLPSGPSDAVHPSSVCEGDDSVNIGLD